VSGWELGRAVRRGQRTGLRLCTTAPREAIASIVRPKTAFLTLSLHQRLSPNQTVSLRMRAAIITTVCVLALLGAAFATHRYIDRTVAQPSRELSKMMSVRLITSDGLSAYYKEHGSYPRSLTDLPLQTLRWGDEGSPPRDLESWHYTSDGQSFSMTWQGMRSTKLFLGGKCGQIYYSEDEKQ
jgi:hypothetical protein